MDPYKELWDNIEKLSPVKRCPKCGNLSLEADKQGYRIYCTKCDFVQEIKK